MLYFYKHFHSKKQGKLVGKLWIIFTFPFKMDFKMDKFDM